MVGVNCATTLPCLCVLGYKLIKTNNGDVASSDIVFVDKGTDAEFKLSGYNKKGRWIQLVLEGIEDRIDSIGIIHRRKTTK